MSYSNTGHSRRDADIQLLKLYKSNNGIDVIQALGPDGVVAIKRTIITEHGEVESTLLREIDVLKNIQKTPNRIGSNRIIGPCKYYVSSTSTPYDDFTNISSTFTPQILNPVVNYMCIEMPKAEGDVHDLISMGMSHAHDLQIMQSVLEALTLLHEMGYCYADLKADNILYFTDMAGNPVSFQLTDFNNTFQVERNLTANYGTFNSMSPELFDVVQNPQNIAHLDRKLSDYWGVGCLVYFLLTGDHIMNPSTLNEYVQEIMALHSNESGEPNKLSQMIDKLELLEQTEVTKLLIRIVRSTLHFNPNNRTFDIESVLDEISNMLKITDTTTDTTSDTTTDTTSDTTTDTTSDTTTDTTSDTTTDPPQSINETNNVITMSTVIEEREQIDDILVSIIKTLYANNISHTEMIEIAYHTTTLVDRHKDFLVNLPFIKPLLNNETLFEVFRNYCCVLALNFVLRYYLEPVDISYFYTVIEDFVVYLSSHDKFKLLIKEIEHLSNEMIENKILKYLVIKAIESPCPVIPIGAN
jgi:serine/threonine protein kinase